MFQALLRAGLLGFGIMTMMSLPAGAFTKIDVGIRTKEYIKSLCSQGSGRRYVEGQGQYGCISNCDGKEKASDACGLNCSGKTNQCYGWSPGTEGKKPSTPAEVMKPAPDSTKSSDKKASGKK